MSNDISSKAMLIGLNISMWSARKQDKDATKKVAEDYGNQEAAARVNKSLIAQDAIKKVQKAANEARQYLYSNSLPWKDDGKRILPAANFLPFTTKLRELESAFWTAVTDLEDNYSSLVADARIMLSGLFKSEDYPQLERLRGKFSFAVSVDPLPTARDFRVNLQSAEVQQIQAQIEQRLNDATAEAMRDLWQRLFDAVSATVDRLSQPDAIFRDSLIENMQELVDLLPRLNLTGDRQLEDLRQQVADRLCIRDPQALRDNKTERADTARDAAAILEAMSSFMGA